MSRTKTKQKSKPEPEPYTTTYNKTELLPFGTGMKLLRVDIPLTIEFTLVLTELCKIKEWDFKRYVTNALHNCVELDLTSPTEIGLDVCKNLKEIIHPEGGT